MAKKLYDVVARVGKYRGQDGQEKTRFQNVGAVLEGDRGPYLLLESWFSPSGVSEQGRPCFLALFPIDGNDQRKPGDQQPALPAGDLPGDDPVIGDDVEF